MQGGPSEFSAEMDIRALGRTANPCKNPPAQGRADLFRPSALRGKNATRGNSSRIQKRCHPQSKRPEKIRKYLLPKPLIGLGFAVSFAWK
jgi:hypothetical protein